MAAVPRALFVPAGPPDSLVAFQITPSDGKVILGRGPLTGIASTFVSRKLGSVWVDEAGVVRFDKIAPAAMFTVRNSQFTPMNLGETVLEPGGFEYSCARANSRQAADWWHAQVLAFACPRTRHGTVFRTVWPCD